MPHSSLLSRSSMCKSREIKIVIISQFMGPLSLIFSVAHIVIHESKIKHINLWLFFAELSISFRKVWKKATLNYTSITGDYNW